MERRRSRLIFWLVLLLVFGCGREKDSSSKVDAVDFVSSNFSPSNPRTTDPITIDPTLVEGKNVELKWMVNGILQDVYKARLSPDHFSKGDTILCLILVDGKEKRKVGPIVIANTKPEVIRVRIEPAEPRNGDELSVQGDVRDPDENDSISFMADWFINGELAFSGEKLPGDKIKAEDEVYAEVEPFDGFERGMKVTTEKIAVQNSLPGISISSLQVEGRLWNYEIEIIDGDGDNVDLTLEEVPPGMRLEGNKLIWEVPEVDKDTSFLVKIKARDERGGETSNSFSLDLKKSEMQ
jgi:hypothetical protein